MMVRSAARPVRISRRPGALEVFTVMTAGALVAPPAQALTPVCPIVLDETRAQGWQEAVSHAAARLAELSHRSEVDCRSIEVHPNVEPPEVVFVTGDGRRAVRTIASPDELADTVDALAVTFMVHEPSHQNETPAAASTETPAEAAPAEAPKASPQPMPAAPVPAPAPAKPNETLEAEPAPPLAVLALSGEVGFRSGQGKGTPVLAGQGTLGLGRLELGVAAQWETGYVGFGEEREDGTTASGVGARLEVGARLFRARPVRVSGGVSLGASALELKRTEDQASIQRDDTLEARLGAFATARIPGTGPVGLRASLVGEWIPSGLRTNQQSTLPSFALMGTLGFEVEAL